MNKKIMNKNSNITDIIVAMDNSGKLGKIKLSLLGECGKFVDYRGDV